MANTAQSMVDTLRSALAKNVGVEQVSYDGQNIKFNRAQLMSELEYWERKAAIQKGKRSLFRGFDMNSAW